MSELRQDIATKQWVIIAKERAKRPHQFIQRQERVAEPEYSPACPFCPGNESQTPPEAFAFRESGTAPNTPGWRVRVVPNKFAALSPGEQVIVTHPEIFTTINGIGGHEVIIESPIHNQTCATLPYEAVEEVIKAALARFRAFSSDSKCGFVAIFRNNGKGAGTSLIHPHSQIIATPIVPTHVRQEIEEARRFYDDRIQCVYCESLARELEADERIVLNTDGYVVLVPFAARMPYEMRILPKDHNPTFANALPDDIHEFAFVLKEALHLLYRAVDNPDYNLVMHNAPLRDSCQDYFHWHVEILPRLTTPAGFELGTGIYINTSVPEEIAQYLRGMCQS